MPRRESFVSQIVVSSGITNVTTVDASNTYLVEMQGFLAILSGGQVSGVTVGHDNELGGWLVESSGGSALGTTISYGGVEEDFGAEIGTTITYGGEQFVYAGGTASSTTI